VPTLGTRRTFASTSGGFRRSLNSGAVAFEKFALQLKHLTTYQMVGNLQFMHASDTRERILANAQTLAQRRGFNAFSYADIAEAVGVRKASIHHHFPSKDDLELALVQRYRQQFAGQLERIDREESTAVGRLRGYADLYRATLDGGAICLCGMMASDIQALPDNLRAPLRAFFGEQAAWLAGVLDSGRKNGELAFRGLAPRRAQLVLAALQGGLIIAHASDDVPLFDALLDDLLTGIVQQ
jgi:TetR/AcrR family transcriptional repressor of nem operon